MWSGNDDPRVFSLVAPYLDIFALLAMRCVSKKIRNVFSRSKIREVLGITDGKQQHDPLVTYDSCFLVFLSLWDFYEEKKNAHDTPWKKAVSGVAQGLVRWIKYTGDMRQGVLEIACMPSVKWAKKNRQQDGQTLAVDNPYVLKCDICDGKPGELKCQCPAGLASCL